MDNSKLQATLFDGPFQIRSSTSEELLEIDAICSQFERDWNTDQRRTIEQCLPLAAVVLRERLLGSLIRSEMELQESELVLPSQKEFESRFPQYLGVVQWAFRPIEESLSHNELALQDPIASEASTQVAARRDSSEIGDNLSQPVPLQPKSFGPYEILSEFARGGMGILYRARHQQLDRVVALKVIKSGLDASEQELARFQTEAQVIAALEHPNIVPIYEVGEYSGYHYFSMPLIDGVNLAERIHERPLPPREAAEIARQIANAIEFAHQHGVIHRDLKPRNILLDSSGVARVTDFGLAKIVERDREEEESLELTLTGQVIGTPAYMAPEQAMGSPSKRSDLYSIGAVLYSLLTGRPPFQAATPLETLRQLQDKEPVEPRRLNAQIPRDLDTITLKCLNKNPESRYSTAADLAKDLERFLTGNPILARPTSRIEHAWRWTKRQPVVASLTAATILSLVAGLGISLWLSSIARNKEKLASQNFDFATATVKKYLTDIASSPELGEKGLERLRQNLLRNAKDFYQQLERSPDADRKVRERLADAHYNLSLISKELGDMDEAGNQADKMIDAYRRLSVESAGSVPFRRSLAIGLQHRGDILSKMSKAEEAEKSFQEAIELYRSLHATTRTLFDQVRIASALAEFGYTFTALDRADDEARLFEEVEKICTEIEPKSDQLVELDEAKDLLKVYTTLASDLQRHNHLERSEKWLTTAVKLSERFMIEHGSDPNLQYDLARVHKSLNLIYTKRQRFEEAKVEFEKGDRIFQRLVSDHPTILQYLDGRANLWINLGGFHGSKGAWADAEPVLKQAIALQSELTAKQPDINEYRLGLAVAYSTLGLSLTKQAKNSEAESAFVSAIQQLDRAAAQRPDDFGLLYIGLSVNNNLASLYRNQHKFQEAVEVFEKAAKGAELLMEKNPNAVDPARSGASIYYNLATVCSKLHENTKSEMAATASRKICENWIAKDPNGETFRVLLLNALICLGETYLSSNRHEESAEPLQRALAEVESLVQTSKDPNRLLGHRGSILFSLGQLQFDRRKFDEALILNSKGILDQRSELALREGKDPIAEGLARELLCTSYFGRARILFRMDRMEEALEACRLGLQMETGSQADGLRSLYGRLLAKSKDKKGAFQILSEIDSSKELASRAYIDTAAAYASLAAESENGAIGSRDRRILVALTKAAKLDPILFAASRNEPEFESLQDWPEFQQLW